MLIIFQFNIFTEALALKFGTYQILYYQFSLISVFQTT